MIETAPGTISSRSTQSKRTLWRERIASWRRSGLSQKTWCEREQVAVSSLGYWIKKLRGTVTPDNTPEIVPRFIPVALTKSNSVTIRIDNAMTIDIDSSIDRSLLKDLLEALRTTA